MQTGNQEGMPAEAGTAKAGASIDQKSAAIITPAAKPSIQSRTLRLISLARNTTEAPMAVMAQVKQPAKKAKNTGCRLFKNWLNATPPNQRILESYNRKMRIYLFEY
jgi:hypothetical protein